jgi:uncharacterized protein YjlB
MVRSRKAQAIRFRDDSIVPNNPHFPVLVYRGVVALSASTFDPATLIDTLIETHGWAKSWRDTVYDFVHYHSQIHEVMGLRAAPPKSNAAGSRAACCRSKRAT